MVWKILLQTKDDAAVKRFIEACLKTGGFGFGFNRDEKVYEVEIEVSGKPDPHQGVLPGEMREAIISVLPRQLTVKNQTVVRVGKKLATKEEAMNLFKALDTQYKSN